MKSTFTSIVLRTANIPAFIVYPFDTLYHSFLIYSKPFRRSMYILFSRASHPAASAVSSAAKKYQNILPALNPVFELCMIKFIFEKKKNMYIFYYSKRVEIQIRIYPVNKF